MSSAKPKLFPVAALVLPFVVYCLYASSAQTFADYYRELHSYALLLFAAAVLEGLFFMRLVRKAEVYLRQPEKQALLVAARQESPLCPAVKIPRAYRFFVWSLLVLSGVTLVMSIGFSGAERTDEKAQANVSTEEQTATPEQGTEEKEKAGNSSENVAVDKSAREEVSSELHIVLSGSIDLGYTMEKLSVKEYESNSKFVPYSFVRCAGVSQGYGILLPLGSKECPDHGFNKVKGIDGKLYLVPPEVIFHPHNLSDSTPEGAELTQAEYLKTKARFDAKLVAIRGDQSNQVVFYVAETLPSDVRRIMSYAARQGGAGSAVLNISEPERAKLLAQSETKVVAQTPQSTVDSSGQVQPQVQTNSSTGSETEQLVVGSGHYFFGFHLVALLAFLVSYRKLAALAWNRVLFVDMDEEKRAQVIADCKARASS